MGFCEASSGDNRFVIVKDFAQDADAKKYQYPELVIGLRVVGAVFY